MKVFLFIVINFIFLNNGCSQTLIDIEIGAKKKVSHVTVTGAYATADTAWTKKMIRYFSSLTFKQAKKGKYSFVVKFIVSKDGSLSDIQCENDPGYGMCEAALRAVIKTKSWVPAPQNGRTVSEYRHRR